MGVNLHFLRNFVLFLSVSTMVSPHNTFCGRRTVLQISFSFQEQKYRNLLPLGKLSGLQMKFCSDNQKQAQLPRILETLPNSLRPEIAQNNLATVVIYQVAPPLGWIIQTPSYFAQGTVDPPNIHEK